VRQRDRERETLMTKLTVAFRKIANAPKNVNEDYYNIINSQIDSTIIILLIISNSSTCFGR